VSRGRFLAAAAVVAVVAAGVALLIVGGGTATADEVRFQNVSEQGPDPFTAPAEAPKASTSSTGGEPSASGGDSEAPPSGTGDSGASGDTSPAGGSGGESRDGTQPGTFGGTGQNNVCDREKLIEELSRDPSKLAAWAEAAGLEANLEAVSAYIRKLRPVTLTEDTQVTNHSYSGGKANPYQAILQKGTAALVDEKGKPVARCRCGNPLSEPVELEQEVKCINCPPNYQPPPPCDAKCYRPEPSAPPVGTANYLESAKQALEACRKGTGDLEQCKALYEKAKDLCAKEPLKDTPQCKDLAKTEPPTQEQDQQGGDTGQQPYTDQGEGETTGTDTTGGGAPPQDGGTTGEPPAPDSGTGTP
jgi:hypothetical protein